MKIIELTAGEDLKIGDAITVKDGIATKINPLPAVTMMEFETVLRENSDGCTLEDVKEADKGNFLTWRVYP